MLKEKKTERSRKRKMRENKGETVRKKAQPGEPRRIGNQKGKGSRGHKRVQELSLGSCVHAIEGRTVKRK